MVVKADIAKYFEEDFLKFVSNRVMAAERTMPGCDIEEYQSYSAQHSRLYEEICSRLGQVGRDLLAEFDFASEAMAAFDVDNAYIQGFADGIIFMRLFKKL